MIPNNNYTTTKKSPIIQNNTISKLHNKIKKPKPKLLDIKPQNIGKYILIGLLCFVFCFGEIFGVMPFAAATLVSVATSGITIVIIPFYLVGSFLVGFDWASILCTLISATVAIIATIYRKQKQTFWIHIIIGILIESLKILLQKIINIADGNQSFLNSISGADILQILICIGLFVSFVFIIQMTISSILTKGNLTSNHLVSIGITLCLLGLGLANFPLANSLGGLLFALVAFLLILISSYMSKGIGILVATCIANGASISMLDGYIIILYCVIGFVVGLSSNYANNNSKDIDTSNNRFGTTKFLSVGIGILSFILLEIAFGDFAINTFALIGLICAGVIYLSLSKSFLDNLKYRFIYDNRHSIRRIIDTTRNNTAQQIKETSKMFDYMQIIMNNLATSAKQKDILAGAITQIDNELCQNCTNLNHCLPTNQRLESIAELIKTGLSKEHISVVDWNGALYAKCTQIHTMTSKVYSVRQNIKMDIHTKQADEYARLCVAKQMGGVATILSNLSQNIQSKTSLDQKIEDKIITELSLASIEVTTVLVSSLDKSTTLVIRQPVPNPITSIIHTIETTISHILSTKMQVTSLDDNAQSTVVINLSVRPKYDVLFATSSIAKNQISGDTHSFIKLGNNKFLMALCDGIGSGIAAEQVSNTAISLVESLYKAGFDSETALDSVNKFLELCGTETFVTLDLAIIDLLSATADIIKIGSPPSFIKTAYPQTYPHSNYPHTQSPHTQTITGNSLPLGILDKTTPQVYRIPLQHGDQIVFCTDGLTDLFTDSLAPLINSINTQNPQTLSQTLLSTALQTTNNQPIDDTTILVAKLFAINQ